MIRKLLLVIIFDLFLFYAEGQKKLVNDSSAVTVRTFSSNGINKYKNDREFQYDRLLEPSTSLWDRFWNWFWNWISEMLSTKSGKQTVTTFLVVLAVAILVYAVMKLTGMTKVGLFGNQNTGEKLPYAAYDDDIHAISFEAEIERAVTDGNFRLAVRLLYLQTLKKLSDKELIIWQINKTNVAYVQELGGTSFEHSFNQLTLAFESNWYGDRHIDPIAFNLVKDEFNQFNQQLR